MKTGIASLPLHYGKAPAWLFGRMTRLARMEMYLGDYIDLDQVLRDLENVKKSEIVEIARELLDDDQLQTTMIIPDN